VLQKRDFTATVYINTGWIADAKIDRKSSQKQLGHYENENFLTWEEVKTLHTNGWSVGSHGVNHLNFTQLNNDVVIKELRQSKQHIENNLGVECNDFAYTWGIHNKSLRKMAKDIGYKFALAAHHSSLNPNDNKYALPRINIENGYSIKDFANIIYGKWDFMCRIQQIKRFINLIKIKFI
jgi:peptidoglycan/xylan/chitin deacetylase (PgdA/CDA1 family)